MSEPAAETKTVVLTSENAAAFYAKKLDLAPETKAEETSVEEVKTEEVKAEEKPKEEVKTEGKEKPPIAKRFSEMTRKIEAAQEETAKERTAREAAENRVKELEGKAAPKVDEDAEPDPEKYTDAFKYNKDLVQWQFRQEKKEAAKASEQAQRDAVIKDFRARQDEFKKVTPDYEEKLSESAAKVSPAMEREILESEVAPQLLYHFAEHPEDAERLGNLPIAKMLKEFGKLEDRLAKPKEEVTEVKETKPAAEISRAPAPITPIKGGNGAVEVPINSKGEFTGTPKEWRDLRRAGKIH